MPIRLDELIIKAKIAESQPSSNNGMATSSSTASQDASIKKVEKAVDAINEMLKRKNER